VALCKKLSTDKELPEANCCASVIVASIKCVRLLSIQMSIVYA